MPVTNGLISGNSRPLEADAVRQSGFGLCEEIVALQYFSAAFKAKVAVHLLPKPQDKCPPVVL
jgi:hypothetical protein